MKKLQKIKLSISRIFDENQRSYIWSNVVEWTIVGLIILSTLEVVLSTIPCIADNYGMLLKVIDVGTTLIFSVEVALRIWVVDLLDEKYKGFWGRIKYCFSFYGFIDIISTYSYYLGFFFELPVQALKVLRILRLLRVFRFMKSFSLLQRAFASKKDEMVISLQFLTIVTLILSFLLFFMENAVQPEVYNNIWTSVIWAFAQYIGDPGGFADFEPVTMVGRLVSCVIGILGIAIFAVPAGLIGSGFIETVEEDRNKEQIRKNTAKLHLAFERKLCRHTRYQLVPPYLSVYEIMARMGMREDEIIDAVQDATDFRLINLAATIPQDRLPEDRLAVENFVVNTAYGCCIDRKSKVTIFSPSNIVDPAIGYFSYYLAKIGGFNYVSRELGNTRPYRSYYASNNVEGFEECMADLNRLAGEDGWVFSFLAASGGNDIEYPTQIHVGFGGEKGDENMEGDNYFVQDKEFARSLYQDIAQTLKERFELECDCQRYHGYSSKKLFMRHLENAGSINNCVIRVAWKSMLWDLRRIQIAGCLAERIAAHICPEVEVGTDPELKIKDIGFLDYKN